MSEENQIVVPPSFVALYLRPGRSRPELPREALAARYELCEDMANMLVSHASTRQWELGVTGADVLERIRRGLLAEGSALTPAEARWVVRRLAELLDWEPLAPGDA